MEYKIYSLTCPILNKVKYIGYTKRSLKMRLYDHENHAKYSDTKKNIWINDLKSKGLSPIIELIDSCDEENYIELEIYWIWQFKSWGFELVNSDIITDRFIFKDQIAVEKYGDKNIYLWDTKLQVKMFKGISEFSEYLNMRPNASLRIILNGGIYRNKYVISFDLLNSMSVYDIFANCNFIKKKCTLNKSIEESKIDEINKLNKILEIADRKIIHYIKNKESALERLSIINHIG